MLLMGQNHEWFRLYGKERHGMALSEGPASHICEAIQATEGSRKYINGILRCMC